MNKSFLLPASLLSALLLATLGFCLLGALNTSHAWGETRIELDYALDQVNDKALTLRHGEHVHQVLLVNTKGLRRPYEGARFSVALSPDGDIALCPMSGSALPCYDVDSATASTLRIALQGVPTNAQREQQTLERTRRNTFDS